MGFHKKEKLADHMLTVHMGAALPAVAGAGGASQPRKPRKPSRPQPTHSQTQGQAGAAGAPSQGGGSTAFGAATADGTGGGGDRGGGGGGGQDQGGQAGAGQSQQGPAGLPLQSNCLKCGQAFSAPKWLQKHKCSYAAAAAAALLQAGAHSFLYASQAPADVA